MSSENNFTPDITDISDKNSQVFPLRTGIMDAKEILKVTKAWEPSHLVASFGFGGLSLSLLTNPTSVYTRYMHAQMRPRAETR